jgi:hypothetical protein
MTTRIIASRKKGSYKSTIRPKQTSFDHPLELPESKAMTTTVTDFLTADEHVHYHTLVARDFQRGRQGELAHRTFNSPQNAATVGSNFLSLNKAK